MTNPQVSIIIVNWNGKTFLQDCLGALREQTYRAFEVIFVDNASKDGSVEYVSKCFPEVKIIALQNNLGFTGGNNAGLKITKGHYICLLNSDTRACPAWLENLVRAMDKNPQAGICGPKLVNPDGSLQFTCGRFPDWRLPFYRRTFLANTEKGKKWTADYLMQDWDHNSSRKVDWFLGACLMVRRSALEKVGLLDERYFMYMEDLDWCRRFWEAGLEVWYVAGAKIIHYHKRESADSQGFLAIFSKSGKTHFLSWLKYYFKYHGKKLPR